MKHLLRSISRLLETLAGVQWITISSADCAAKQYKLFIKDDKLYSSMENFAMNERIYYLYFGLLSKLTLSTGDLKDVKKSLFCLIEMHEWNKFFI